MSDDSEGVVSHLLIDQTQGSRVVKPVVAASISSAPALPESNTSVVHFSKKKLRQENESTEGNATASGFPALTSSVSYPSRGTDATSSEKLEDGMDVDEEEEDEEDDDASGLSEGDDLQGDLEDALASNSSFTGNFYHANILTTAPNPCLYVSGLGLVGLPLSERDAKSIVSQATLSPFGHGERTMVDKEVRDTWEIEPDKLVFGNPEWSKYIDGVVCSEVGRALGVIGSPPPKLELYKLLLYEKGSHFLPHQDTQKANGMFATVAIVLPSAYTGGQVVVSHSSTTKTIDFAPNSLLSTAVLAWYTDVKHEVKPIISGYRLVLTYNFIHTASPGVPQPTLPLADDSVDKLRRVLMKWRDGKYAQEPEMPLLAYLLQHEYSSQNLKDGFGALKGVDAHLVTFLRDIAEELGYMVGLATLERNISGPGDDCGGGGRNRYDLYSSSDDDDDDAPEMVEASDTTTRVVGLVDLKGFPLPSLGNIELDDSNLVPADPFEDVTPDKVDYEGYMGNYAGDVTHWYHRTVLVLVHEKDIGHVCFSVAGIPYAFQKLTALGAENSLSPSADAKLWVDRIVSKADRLSKEQALKMLDLAMKWNDVEVFKKIMKAPVCVANMDVLLKAWKMFSFEAVQSCFEQALDRSCAFSEKIKLISTIRSMSNEDKSVVSPWCKTQTCKILASYTQLDVKDIPIIMTVVRRSGWSVFTKILLPTILKRPNTYAFLIAVVKTLLEARQSLLDQLAKAKAIPQSDASTKTEPGALAKAGVTKRKSANEEDGKNPVDKTIEHALEAAAKQWSHVPASFKYAQHTDVAQTGKVDRIVEIADQTIASDNLDICRTLFIDVLKSTGTSAGGFTQIYKPLIPRLRTLLQSKRLDLFAVPFVDLFQVLIGTYLRDVLRKKGQQSDQRLRKIGCGCQDCQPLDTFILDPTSQTTLFRLVLKRRLHLESRIANARDLCTYQTIKWGSPHGVQVTKLAEVVEASTWVLRQKAAKGFLLSIGTDEVIKKIMGARYTDVVAAVNGTAPFGGGSTSKATSSATVTQKATAHRPAVGGAATSHTGSSSSRIASSSGANNLTNRNAVAPSTQAVPPPQLAGRKRKHNLAVDLGVDLT